VSFVLWIDFDQARRSFASLRMTKTKEDRFAQDDEGLASRETKYPLGIASQALEDEKKGASLQISKFNQRFLSDTKKAPAARRGLF